jgi:hypothetical protein
MKIILLIILVVTVSIFSACTGNSGKVSDPSKPLIEGMKNFNLKDYGVNITFPAPVNSQVKASGTGAELSQGSVFSIHAASGTGDINLIKNDIKNDEVRKFVRFITEEPDLIVFECETAGKAEFHFWLIKKSDQDVVEIRDNIDFLYTEDQISKMVNSAKSSVFN